MQNFHGVYSSWYTRAGERMRVMTVVAAKFRGERDGEEGTPRSRQSWFPRAIGRVVMTCLLVAACSGKEENGVAAAHARAPDSSTAAFAQPGADKAGEWTTAGRDFANTRY